MMKGALAIFAIGLIVITLTLAWMDGTVSRFTDRCEAAGGHPMSFGTAMSSWKCVTPDGRILSVPGPGIGR